MSGYLVVNRACGYAGIDREPWSVIEDIYYSGSPRPWRNWYEREVLNSFSREFGVPLVSFGIIKKVFEILTEQENVHDFDVIFVSAKSEEDTPETGAEFLGLDLYFSGYGSPIMEGFIKFRDFFSDCSVKFNRNGLLESEEDCLEYMNYYNKVSCEANLEDFLSGGPSGVCALIWSISPPF